MMRRNRTVGSTKNDDGSVNRENKVGFDRRGDAMVSSARHEPNAGDTLRSMKESTGYARIITSILMQGVVLGYVAHIMYQGGVGDVITSFYRAKMPWTKACGLSDLKEYVMISDKIVGRGGMTAGGIHVRGGMIAATYFHPTQNLFDTIEPVVGKDIRKPKIPVIDFGNYVIGPGVIDVHVHMNEPGREDWERMDLATLAAAAGGVTTVVDMPLNSKPCTTHVRELKRKMDIARLKNKTFVDVGFWGGLVPENAYVRKELGAMVKAGALGFKAFMVPSGIEDFPHVSAADIEVALPVIQDLNVPLLVHAELADDKVSSTKGLDPRSHASWLAMRPPHMERRAIAQLIEALEKLPRIRRPNFGLHIVHLSDAESIKMIEEAKKRRLPISVETCPHYLLFSNDDVGEGQTEYKCAPPIRDAKNMKKLRHALVSGQIDGVSSDHSPAPPNMKLQEKGDFLEAWGGISGLQYLLPATWDALRQEKPDVTPWDLHNVLSYFPAKLIGMKRLKGYITGGHKADFVVWDPNAAADTSVGKCFQKQKLTPYIGRLLYGKVMATIVDGSFVFREDNGPSSMACGHPLRRKVDPRDEPK